MRGKLAKICSLGSLALFLVVALATTIVIWSFQESPITPIQGAALIANCPLFTAAGNDAREVVAVSHIVRGDHSIPSLYYADVAWRPQNRSGQTSAVLHSDVSFARLGNGSWSLLDFTDLTNQHKPGVTIDLQGRSPELKAGQY